MNNDFVVETLHERDFDEWVGHCGSIFSVGPEYFRRHFVSDPYKDFNSIFIIKDSGKIVSTVRVFHREVYIYGNKYKMGGIGEVSTHKDYRSKGMSYKLLEIAVQYMKENDFTVSMLGTGYFSHYAKHGFIQVNEYQNIVEGGRIISGNCDIRPLDSSYYGEMSNLYNTYAPNVNCILVRSKDYWNQWCAAEMKNPRGLFKDGKLCGYICFNGNTVSEIIADNTENTVNDMLLSVLSDEKIKIPSFVKTNRKKLGEETHKGTMINLFKPITDAKTCGNTAELVKELNDRGGIFLCGCDHF